MKNAPSLGASGFLGAIMLVECDQVPTASCIRGRMEDAIAECLSGNRLRLIGSWASGEAHIPNFTAEKVVHSFSDIDLVSIGDLQPHQKSYIQGKLDASAKSLGLQISGVSIRSISELNHLPHACDWRPSWQQNIFCGGKITYIFCCQDGRQS